MYKKGTQAQLDVAREDATLIPMDTLFRVSEKSEAYSEGGVCFESIESVYVGSIVVREECLDDASSVGFKPVLDGKILDVDGCAHMNFLDLEPIND